MSLTVSRYRCKKHPSLITAGKMDGIRIGGIKLILTRFLEGPQRYTDLNVHCGIRHKQTFNKYLQFCKNHGLVCKDISKDLYQMNKTFRGKRKPRFTYFHITDKGKAMLSLIGET